MNFRKWLQEQKTRQDRIGRFARFILDKEIQYRKGRRKFNEHRQWASTVTYHGNLQAVYAFNDAWEEFQEDTE